MRNEIQANQSLCSLDGKSISQIKQVSKCSVDISER